MSSLKLDSAEVELAAETLLTHLSAWLLVQPEYVLFIGSADRTARRRLAGDIAKMLTTIPAREQDIEANVVNRALRRRIAKQMARDSRWSE